MAPLNSFNTIVLNSYNSVSSVTSGLSGLLGERMGTILSSVSPSSVPLVMASAANNGALVNFFASANQFQTVLPGMTLMALGSIIATLTTLLATSNQYKDLMTNPNPSLSDPPEVYDFIVVGSGTAGGIVASRLSENGLYRVLLLEAGGDPLPMHQVPYLFSYNLNQPETDWGYKTVPQKYSLFGSVNKTTNVFCGKTVGGTSTLNGMIYMRGSPKDFDNWASITGDSQWNYENVLPYFKKSERYDGIFKTDLLHHGQQGPIPVTFPSSNPPLFQAWLEAGREFGYPVADLNARQNASFGPMEFTAAEGIRWETYKGYIKPALERRNFKLIRYAHVLKINLNKNKEATGVTYIRNGQSIEVRASKEVILSAGSIGSPQLLMLSGIGSSSDLISLGITPAVNLPGVGKGLKDHVLTPIGPFLLNDSVSFIPERDLTYSDALNYLVNKQGPIATNPGSGQLALISTTGDQKWPDVEGILTYDGLTPSTAGGLQSRFNLKSGILQKYLEELGTQDAAWVYLSLGRPKSVGELKLASNNPMDSPLIDPNYFSDPGRQDIKAMVKGFRLFVDVLEKSNAFKKYNTTLLNRPLPGCENYFGDRDRDYECRIRQFTSTSFHPTSTCRMGKLNDPNAVVDSLLRVRGVRKLRIADASVMPDITNANINAPIMMIAEKAADFILNEWCTPDSPEGERPLLFLERVIPFKLLSRGLNNRRAESTTRIQCPIPPE